MMQIEEMSIPGVMLITGKISEDIRGLFFKPFSSRDFLTFGVEFKPKEVFYSISGNNVIRGMHFQRPPSGQAKIVTVIKGEITDVVLDLRRKSNHYGKIAYTNLSEKNRKSILMPEGVAHGFIGRNHENIVLYLTDSDYSKENEDGIKFDTFGYDWGITDPVISQRDSGFINFEDFISPFE